MHHERYKYTLRNYSWCLRLRFYTFLTPWNQFDLSETPLES